ncbi:MAG: glycosyltransferase family 39 protein [Saprospiraceae bacterium]|nr:glycosyltransferase family 39 protein [Saprospiraceae bacterium]
MKKKGSHGALKVQTPFQQTTMSLPEHTAGPFYTQPFLKKYGIASLIILGLSLGMYHVCLPFGYVLDDKMVITDNAYTKKGFSGIWEILTTESFEGYFGEKKELVQGNRYRPLSIVTFAMEYGIEGKLNPKLSHMINILLYALTSILLMMVLALLFRNQESKKWWFSLPFFAALLFVAHPVHTEAVANIKGRDEIMSMLFSLGALYSVLRYTDHFGRGWLIAGMVSYFLGLLSKENAITFLALIPLTLWFFTANPWPAIKKSLLWLGIMTFAYLILRFNTAGVPKLGQEMNDLMNNPFLGMNAGERFGAIMYTLGKYIQLMVWPHPLSHDYYPYAIPKESIFSLIPMASLILYGALLYFAVKGLKTRSVYAYSVWFWLITLSIVSNVVINLGTFMNERFIFMSSAGACIAFAWFLTEKFPSMVARGNVLSLLVVLGATVGLAAKTYVRVPVWKDALSLNTAAVRVSTNSARANSFMSTALFEEYKVTQDLERRKKLLDQVEMYANRAVEIVPEYQYPNLMLVGAAAEKFKIERDIRKYIDRARGPFVRRPDISYIKEYSDYLKTQGYNTELFPFYLEVGNELLKVNDKRREWALMFLTYAYEINPASKQVNESLATAHELVGNASQAQYYRNAANSLR